MRIGFVGGTGPAGRGLAARFALAGIPVLTGSRRIDRAEEARNFVLSAVPGAEVAAVENAEAVRGGDVVVVTVPPDAQRETCAGLASELAGKIVVSMTNPVRVQGGRVWHDDVPEGSLAEAVASVAPGARVVGAFHEIHVRRLARVAKPLVGDTIVTGDDLEAKRVVSELVRSVRDLRPVDGGGLENTRHVEAFVTVLVQVNFNYKAATSVRIEGLPPDA